MRGSVFKRCVCAVRRDDRGRRVTCSSRTEQPTARDPASSAVGWRSGTCQHRAMAIDRVTVDPAQMGGVPCIRGTRVTVSMLLGQLAAGRTPTDIVADYPYLEPEDVTAS